MYNKIDLIRLNLVLTNEQQHFIYALVLYKHKLPHIIQPLNLQLTQLKK